MEPLPKLGLEFRPRAFATSAASLRRFRENERARPKAQVRTDTGVVAIYSPKGGVGKTTIAVDFAWRCAARHGHRTLLWDLDSQGGSGFLLNAGMAAAASVPAPCARAEPMWELIDATRFDNLFYLGLAGDLSNFPFDPPRLDPKQRLVELVEALRKSFHRIILDCPPVRNEVSEQIFAAADLIIVPLPASPLAARALDRVRQDLSVSRRKPPILPVFSMYDSRRKAHREARDGWMAKFPVIPAASQIEQGAFRRAPIGTFSPSSPAAIALERLSNGIEHKLKEIASRRAAS